MCGSETALGRVTTEKPTASRALPTSLYFTARGHVDTPRYLMVTISLELRRMLLFGMFHSILDLESILITLCSR